MNKTFQLIYLSIGSIVAVMQGASLINNAGIERRSLKELHRAFIIDRPWILFMLVIILFILGIIAIYLRNKDKNLSIIKSLLDSLHSTYFDKCLPEDKYKYRISIFTPSTVNIGTNEKPVYQTKLNLYARSGVSYQKTEKSFIINNEKEEDNEGVPGRAWFINGPVQVELPEYSNNNKEEYVNKMLLSPEKLNELSVKPRSVYAAPVHMYNKRFGVIVFDSRVPNTTTIQPEKTSIVNSTLALINNLPVVD